LVEQPIRNRQVIGSSPIVGSSLLSIPVLPSMLVQSVVTCGRNFQLRSLPNPPGCALDHSFATFHRDTIAANIGLVSGLISAGGSVPDQLFGAMRQSIIDGAPDTATALAQQALAHGVDPLEAVNQGFAAGITFAGEQFGCGEMFLPDLLASAEAMKAAISILEPEMLKRGSQRENLGKVVLGTAKGDIHDIGKNLVATILSASGFQIFDLGTSVTPEQFVAKAREVDADIVGVSALLTTTMAGQKAVIEALDRNGLRPRVKAIIGGAAVTSKWAAEIGADGYSRNAIDALELAKNLMSQVTNKGTALA
jgi:corrinoid protein of di/trimethylamine methyltransferase